MDTWDLEMPPLQSRRFRLERAPAADARQLAARLSAVRGIPATSLRTAIKAATWHDLAVEAVAGGWRARCILDV